MERLLQARLNFIMAKLGKGSQTGYQGAWRQWCLFCRARKRDPYLLGRDAREEREDEEVLLDFVTYLGHYMHRTAGTIQSKLMGVRFQHLTEGVKDPLHQKGRIWLTLGGIKRLAKKEQRKWPATVAMLRWCAWRYHCAMFDQFVVYAATVLAWFFALRGGEYTEIPGQPWQQARILTGADVVARRGVQSDLVNATGKPAYKESLRS